MLIFIYMYVQVTYISVVGIVSFVNINICTYICMYVYMDIFQDGKAVEITWCSTPQGSSAPKPHTFHANIHKKLVTLIQIKLEVQS